VKITTRIIHVIRNTVIQVLVGLIAWVLLIHAEAQAQPTYTPIIGGVRVHCNAYGTNAPVLFVANPQLPDVGKAVPGAPPSIIMNPLVLARYPARIQLFWYGHECGHHVLGPANSESNADCWSVQTLRDQGLATREDIAQIRAFIQNNPGTPWGHLPGPERVRHLLQCYDNRGSTPVPGGGLSSRTCQFTKGPRTGRTQFFPQAQPIPLGSSCNDGLTSSGISVPDKASDGGARPFTSSVQGGGATSLRKTGASISSKRPATTSRTCQFEWGPRAGQRQFFPQAQSIPLGSQCTDGLGSTGLSIPDNID